jgi:eukaryotic-like serine/threonine-protein kinase
MTGIPDGAPVAVVAGRYRLRELVGTGGMGAVWRAADELLGREVALKQVRITDQQDTDVALARERIMREARIAAALHHPHIVSIFDVVLEDGEPWLVLEFLPSRSLGSVLAERGTLPAVEVAAIGADVAEALAAAHAAGIVHRDVKPDNVLLSRPSAAGPLVKLTDFGIAHTAAAPALTATQVLTGTPAYFAPETARGEGTDSRSDVYSLGATLYAAVEGHPPFGADTGNVLALLARIGRGGAPLPLRAGELSEVLSHLTADDPSARPTAAQAHAALRAIAEGRPSAGPPPAGLDAGPTGKPPRRGPRAVIAVVAVLVVVAGVLAAVAVYRPSGPPVAAPTTTAPTTATIADPDTADPCSLLDPASVERFGTTTLDPDNVLFAGCRADITRPDGGAIGFTVAFESRAETRQIAGASRTEEFGYPIMRYPPGDDYCEQRIQLGDGNAVLVSAVRYEDPSGATDLCAIAQAGRAAALARLVNQGIGERQPLSATSPLAGIPACGLLTSEEIAAAMTDPSPPQPHFGGWGCNWNDYLLGDRVAVTYYRGFALGNSDGTPSEFAGHPGAVLAREGNCWVQFVQRSYSVRGSDRVEAVWVTYWGTGTGDQLCQTATTLATAVAGRLPPPS